MTGHKMRHRASGGKVADEAKDQKESDGGKPKAYDAQGSNVEKEAEERKRGGKVDKKKERKRGGKVEGEKPKMRMDRACRKDGGRVGSDKSPFTSARHTSGVVDHRTDD